MKIMIKSKFIINVIKYDKLILYYNIDFLVEIDYDDIANTIFFFEYFLKYKISKEKNFF